MPIYIPDDLKRLPSPENFQSSRAQPAATAAPKPAAAGGRFMDGWNTGPNHTAADETRARARSEGAQWQAEQERARQDRANAARPTPAPTQKPPGVISKGRNLLNKGVAGRLGAAALLSSAAQPSFDEDSTQRYAQRFGVNEPTGDGRARDIAKFAGLRAGGFATDLADTLTFGQASRLYRDNEQANGNPNGAQAMGQVVGGATGWNGIPVVGKLLDKAATVVTRGKYKGNLSEKILSNKVARAGGALGGAVLGGAVALDANNMTDGAVAVEPKDTQSTPEAVLESSPEAIQDKSSNLTGGIRSFTNKDARRFAPDSINTMPKEAVMSASPATDARVSAALQAAAARGDWDAVARYYDSKGQDFNGKGFKQPENRVTVIKDGNKAPSNADLINTRMANAQSALQQQGKSLDQQSELGFRKMNLEENVAQDKIARNNRLMSLYEQYDKAKTDKERSKIALLIQQFDTKAGGDKLKDNYVLVGGGQEWDDEAGAMRNVPQSLIDLRTGLPVNNQQQQQKQQPEFEDGKYYQDASGNIVYYQNGKAIPYNG